MNGCMGDKGLCCVWGSGGAVGFTVTEAWLEGADGGASQDSRAAHLVGWHGGKRLWSQLLQRGFSIDYSSPLKSKQKGRALGRCILIL